MSWMNASLSDPSGSLPFKTTNIFSWMDGVEALSNGKGHWLSTTIHLAVIMSNICQIFTRIDVPPQRPDCV